VPQLTTELILSASLARLTNNPTPPSPAPQSFEDPTPCHLAVGRTENLAGFLHRAGHHHSADARAHRQRPAFVARANLALGSRV